MMAATFRSVMIVGLLAAASGATVIHREEAKEPLPLMRRVTISDSAALVHRAHQDDTSGTYAAAVLASNPVAYWNLADPVGAKASGQGPACGQPGGLEFGDPCFVAGDIHGSPQLGQPGLISNNADKAITFDGTADQEIVIPDNEYININASGYLARTVELWFKMGDHPVNMNRTIFEEGTAGHSGVNIYVGTDSANASELFMYAWDRGNDATDRVDFGDRLIVPKPLRCPIQKGKAYYAAFVFDSANNEMSGWIKHPDNSNVEPCGAKLQLPFNSVIGHHGHGAGNAIIGGVQGDTRWDGITGTTSAASHNFVGTIDEVAIYNRALPQSEMQVHTTTAESAPAAASTCMGFAGGHTALHHSSHTQANCAAPCTFTLAVAHVPGFPASCGPVTNVACDGVEAPNATSCTTPCTFHAEIVGTKGSPATCK